MYCTWWIPRVGSLATIIQEVRHHWTTRVAYNQTTTEVLIHASASSFVQACQGTSDSLQSGIEQCY